MTILGLEVTNVGQYIKITALYLPYKYFLEFGSSAITKKKGEQVSRFLNIEPIDRNRDQSRCNLIYVLHYQKRQKKEKTTTTTTPPHS